MRITLIRAALPVKCPSCGADISWGDAAGVQFDCSGCGHGLRLRGTYFGVLYLVALGLVLLLCHAASIRGNALIAAMFLGLAPTYVLFVFINVRLFAPDVESTGDFRAILYGAPRPAVTSAASEPTAEGGGEDEFSASLPDDPPEPAMFKSHDEHRTLEGFAVGGAGILFAAWIVWSAATPVIQNFFPDFGATQSGRAGFTVRVYFGREAIAFTNGSTEAWACKATLRYDSRFASSFWLEP